MEPISIIIPCYNCSKTIDETMSSVLNGNLEAFDEVILCDDASTDDTLSKISSWEKKDERIHIVAHSFNKGGGAARNTAAENAKHALLFCLDSDNILLPGSLEKLRVLQEEKNTSISIFEEVWYFLNEDEQKKITHRWRYRDKYGLEDILAGYVFPGCDGNYLFTKASWKRVGRYPEGLGAMDTWGFGLRQFALGETYAFLLGGGYLHRYGYDSYYVRESRKTDLQNLLALSELLPFFDEIEEREIRYLCSEKGRKSWYTKLEKHPIKLKHKKTGCSGNVIR